MIKVQPNVEIRNGESHSKYKNNMVQGGLNWLVNFVLSGSGSQVSHIVIGDSSNPVSLGDVALHNELARKPITSMENDNGTAYLEIYLSEAEANFHWREVGLIAGGSDELGTGTLIARCLVDEDKDSRRTATVSWSIGFANM